MLANWVRETISAGGTGNLTLSGAESGFIKFSDFFATSQIFYYSIEDGSNREIGVGHLSDSTTLVRDKILETLVSGTYDKTSPAAITATTSAVVMCSASAQTSFSSLPGFYEDGLGSMHPGLDTDASTNLTQPGQSVLASPLYLTQSVKLSALSVNLATSTSTGNIYIGVYGVGIDGLPGRLLASTGALSSTTTGLKSGSTTETLIHPGWYYTAIVIEEAGTISITASSGTTFSAAMNQGTKRGITSLKGATTNTTLPSDLSGETYSSHDTGTQIKIWLESA